MSSDALGEALFALAGLAVRRRHRELSLTAASTLATLERGPRRLTDLAVCEEVTQPAMTVLVHQLVEAGLVERRSDARDARVVLVAITAAGLGRLRALRSVGASSFATLIDKLDPDEQATLAAALPILQRLPELAEQ